MTNASLMNLLFDCRRRLSGILPGALAHRSAVRRIDGYLDALEIDPAVADNIVIYARNASQRVGGLQIDRGETLTRAHPEGIEVRAWYLVPHEIVTSLEKPERGGRIALMRISPTTRRVLTLKTQQGLSIKEIARTLGIPRWLARWHLRKAVRAVARAISGGEDL